VSDATTRAKDCFEMAAKALDEKNIDLAVGWRELGDAFLRAQDADMRKNLVPA
jgi:hypothetical protein